MAVTPTTAASGSQAATIGTEHNLLNTSSAGVYQVVVDANALANGATPDILRLRVYSSARSGDTERLVGDFWFQGAQAQPLIELPPFVTTHALRVTLTQTQGTGRTYPWSAYTW
ncbi:MAG: hypothetical protein ONB55_22405 [candidate division KSB1 bacterium]|nr:hypothetical protein [candidate division KSB1 bacterium]